MELSDLILEARDATRTRAGIVKLGDLVASKISSARFVPKHLAAGDWDITVPAESRLADLIAQRGHGIVLTGPAGPIISGSVDRIIASRSPEDGTGIITAHGVDDTALCWHSRIRPTPSATLAAQVDDQYVVTGVAETVMYDLVDKNLGPGARADRRGPLALDVVLGTNLARGSAYTSRNRFGRVGDELAVIAALNGLGFRIVQRDVGGTDKLVYEVYETVDRSSLIRLSLRNRGLEFIEYTLEAPTLTHPQVAGQGEGAERTIIEHTNAAALAAEAAWGFHIEAFIDRRDTDDPDELEQEGEAQLADGGEKVVPRIVPADAPNMIYGRHWHVGDRIAVDDTETVVTVQAALITVDASGVSCAAALT